MNDFPPAPRRVCLIHRRCAGDEAGLKPQYSPCRLGNVWYVTNDHTVTFPLW